jgi:hypothetical protein
MLQNKPITLTIIPQPQSVKISTDKQYGIPSTITQVNNQISFEDRELLRIKKNRENQRKHVAKVKPYKQLANIADPDLRVIASLVLSHPEFSQIPEYRLCQDLDIFIEALRSKYL